jgi:hypothetical protein
MIQSILFSRKYFTVDMAIDWLIRHGYSHEKVDIKKNHFRFRQVEPQKNARYVTYPIDQGKIDLILMYPH